MHAMMQTPWKLMVNLMIAIGIQWKHSSMYKLNTQACSLQAVDWCTIYVAAHLLFSTLAVLA